MTKTISALLLAAAAIAPFGCTPAADAPKPADVPAVAPDTAKPAAVVTKPYPLATCVVSGEEFGGEMGDPVIKVYDGREIKFCCKSCVPKYEKDPGKYNAKLDAAAAAKAPGETPAPGVDDHRHDGDHPAK